MLNSTLLATKRMSIAEDDMPARCWTRIPAQFKVWEAGKWRRDRDGVDPLVLKIWFRMGVSHVYDCMWDWRTHLDREKKLAEDGENNIVPDQQAHPSIQPETTMDRYADFGMNLDYLDMFNSMDWMLEENLFTQLPVSYDPASHGNLYLGGN